METINNNTNRRRYDGFSQAMAVDHNGYLVAGDTVIDGIEREEVLFALNAYKNTKRVVKSTAKFLIFSAIIIGTIATTIYLLSITDVGVLQ